MEKFGLKPNAKLVYLEEMKEKATQLDKVASLINAKLMPQFLLHRMLGLNDCKPDDLITIIFTSGSTGNPKGSTPHVSQRSLKRSRV